MFNNLTILSHFKGLHPILNLLFKLLSDDRVKIIGLLSSNNLFVLIVRFTHNAK